VSAKDGVGRAVGGSEFGAVPGLGEALGPSSDQRRDLVVEPFSYAAAVRGTSLRPALNSQLRTGTDSGNPTV